MAALQVFRRPMVAVMGLRKDKLIGTGSITLDVSGQACTAVSDVSDLPVNTRYKVA
jgi:hypothetical protein